MAIFRRKSGDSNDAVEPDSTTTQSTAPESTAPATSDSAPAPFEFKPEPLVEPAYGVGIGEAGEETVTPVVLPDGGPWDINEAPADELPRLDLGALKVPIVEGIEMNIEAAPDTGAVTGVNYTIPNVGIMQVSVFAAPKTSGIWEDVRQEIIDSAVGAGGSLAIVEGTMGLELRGTVPTDQPGQLAPARFVGIDGPRWFARAVLSGQPAVNDEMGEALLALFRMCIVDRGTEALPVRDLLTMTVPREVQELAEQFAADAAAQPAQATSKDFNPFERGPEITERR